MDKNSAIRYFNDRILQVDATLTEARRMLDDLRFELARYIDNPEEWSERNVPISDLPLTIRTQNCLRGGGILTLSQIMLAGEYGLMALPNFGKAALNEVKEVLRDRGLSLPLYVSDIENLGGSHGNGS